MMPERDDISQMIETEAAAAIHDVLDRKNSDFKQLIVMFMTVISMTVGVVLWATNSHASIKDWTSEQAFVTKYELQEVIKEHYVKQKEFVIVQQKLENLNEKHEKLLETLDKMDRKLDSIDGRKGFIGRQTK